MSTQPRWRLTEGGRRLWRLYVEFTLVEVDGEAEFIDMLASDPIQLCGICLSCGLPIEWMTAGFFCLNCCRSTYQKENGNGDKRAAD